MRIRRRPSVPLPFSFLSPPTTTLPSSAVLVTDPPSKPAQQQVPPLPVGNTSDDETKTTHFQQQDLQSLNLPMLEEDHHHHDPPPRSTFDLQLTIIRGKNGWICSDNGDERRNEKKKELFIMIPNSNPPVEEKKKTLHGLQEEEDEEEEMKRSCKDKTKRRNHKNIRKRNGLSGAEAISGSAVPSSSFITFDQAEAGMKWKGEKVFPLKKRSTGMSFERNQYVRYDNPMTMITENKDHHHEDQNNNKIVMVKNKLNTKKILVNHHHDHEKDLEEDRSINSGKNKRKNGGGVIEGSRCSRVNGSGWRCSQQPLVGYSLCGHHLGKGRLMKSMSSVQSRSTSTSINITKEPQKKIIKDHVMSMIDEKEEGPLLKHMTKKRKNKIGKVKARSLSSLLGQTQHGISSS